MAIDLCKWETTMEEIQEEYPIATQTPSVVIFAKYEIPRKPGESWHEAMARQLLEEWKRMKD